MEGLILAVLISWREPKFSSPNKSLERISKPSIKRKGDRGSPLPQTPGGKNLPKGAPSRRVKKEDVVIH
jgi:hypothetical protein